jgi:hypothetical protein
MWKFEEKSFLSVACDHPEMHCNVTRSQPSYFRREPRSADIGQVDQNLDGPVTVIRGIAPPFIEIDDRPLLPRL